MLIWYYHFCFDRAYCTLVKLQQLAELEEVIEFKQSDVNSTKRTEIQGLWAKRLLEGCRPDTDVWHSILQVRTKSGCMVP